jgi:hypothetical protein
MLSYLSDLSYKDIINMLCVIVIIVMIITNYNGVYKERNIILSLFLLFYILSINYSQHLDFISEKTGLDHIPIVLLSGFLMCLLIVVIESVKFSKETDENVKKNRKNTIISFSVYSVILLSIFIYLVYSNSQKSIAYKLIALSTLPKKEETLKEASTLCDKLFNKAESGVRDQFLDMKNKRPVEEVRNICFNYARSLAQ